MKITPLLACCLALFLAATPRIARAEEVSFDFFYNSLADDGDWYNTPDYGYVWQPYIAYKSDKWRPYSDGYWAQTEDGWTWVAYENFGWATYHYGRWTRLEDTGWVWVPGYEWGPGWVSWRTSDDVVGWAPLPPKRTRPTVYEGKIVDREPAPRASVSIGYNDVEEDYSVGYNSRVDEDYDIGPANYCFVETRSFGAPVLSAVLLPPVQNVTYVENTVNVTNIIYRGEGPRRVIYNNGPSYAFISGRSERPIQQLRIERRDDLAYIREGIRTHGNANRVQNGVFEVAAPVVSRREVNFQEMRPLRVKQDLKQVQVNRGWQGLKADPQAITKVREQIKRQANEKPTTQNVGSIPPAGQQFQARDASSVPPTPQNAVERNPAVPGVQPRAGAQGPALTDAERAARRDQRQSEREQRDTSRTRGQQPPSPAVGTAGQPANTDPQVAQEREARRAARQQGQTTPKAQPTPTGDPERDAKRAARQQARAQQGQQPPPATAAAPDPATPPAVSDQEREARRAARQQDQQQPRTVTKPQPTPTGDPERDAKRAVRQQARAQQEQNTPPANAQADQERSARQAARQQQQQSQQADQERSARQAARQQQQQSQQADQERSARQAARQQQQQSQQADQERSARQAARQQERQQQPQAQPQRSDEERATRQAARQQERQPQPQPQAQAQPQRSDEERATRQAARQQQKQEQPKADDDKKKKGDGQ